MNPTRTIAIAKPANRLALSAAALLALAAVFALLTVNPSAAGNGYDPKYRFCVSGVSTGFGTDIPDCAYTSMQQCQASASGRGYCTENPGYAGYQAPPQRRGYR